MKKFIKGRWFPLVAAMGVVAVVVFVMVLLGWRITYAPELENSWDAISAVAALVGVFASFAAIMVAIWIPKRIADRQDKIALFEKRLQCQMAILSMIKWSNYLYSDCRTYQDIIFGMGVFLNFPKWSEIPQYVEKSMHDFMVIFQTDIMSGRYLFDDFEEDLIEKAYDLMNALVISILVLRDNQMGDKISKETEKSISDLNKICNEINNNTIPKIDKALKIDADRR